MREITYTAAAREALAERMAVDPTIFVVGEGIGPRGGNADTAYYLEQMAKRNWQVVDEAYYTLVQEDWHSDIGPILAHRPADELRRGKPPVSASTDVIGRQTIREGSVRTESVQTPAKCGVRR